MDDVEKFLNDAAALAGSTPDDLLSRVLHVEDTAISALVDGMNASTRAITLRLDREVRVRNPGLHYVIRTMFVGYRREGAAVTPAGERSQIFMSVIRANSRLDIVLPVDPNQIDGAANAEDLRGKGHHGVGNVRISLHNDSDVDQFLVDFSDWLMPHP